MAAWDGIDNSEKCRRLIDLFLISVLLDAGAGTEWSYKSTENGRMYRRSEGIAVASLEMFKTVWCTFATPANLNPNPRANANIIGSIFGRQIEQIPGGQKWFASIDY